MTTPSQKLSIIIMDDKGKTRRFRYSTWGMKTFCIIILLLPIITGIASYFALNYSRTIGLLEKEKQVIEQALIESEKKIERLARLQTLLESTIQPVIIKQETQDSSKENAQAPTNTRLQTDPSNNIETHKKILESNLLQLKKVHIRRVGSNNLRITLDLENTNAVQTLAGSIKFSFLFPDGSLIPLKTDDYSFRIRRFKEIDNTIALTKKVLENIDAVLVVAEVHLDKIIQHRAYYPIPTP